MALRGSLVRRVSRHCCRIEGALNSPAFSARCRRTRCRRFTHRCCFTIPAALLQPEAARYRARCADARSGGSDQIRLPEYLVAAVGNVHIYFRGSTIEAYQIIYDKKAKRLIAEGNARLTEQDGHITYGQVINLTDDYRDGFVDLLRVDVWSTTRDLPRSTPIARRETTQSCRTASTPLASPAKTTRTSRRCGRSRQRASSTTRAKKCSTSRMQQSTSSGYRWRTSRLMSTPDPTVCKSGFLYPTPSYSKALGYSLETRPTTSRSRAGLLISNIYRRYMTQQGFLMEGEWNQRLTNGSYSIHAAGIPQQDPSYFASEYGPTTEATKDFRGSVLTTGQFDITDRWVWGWTGVLVSDPTFISDYGLGRVYNGANLDPFRTGVPARCTEGVSQLYLVGRGTTSYFDIRSIYYTGYSELDQQSQLPIIHPVLDYSAVLPQQILGGELSYKVNLTSLSRQQASYDAINTTAANTICVNGSAATADPALLNKANCLLRGIPGDYTRGSAQFDWRRTVITDSGLTVTPFLRVSGDVASLNVANQAGVSNYITPGDSELARVMPVAGAEFRYPFIDSEPWGTQTIEPIAQLILRPNEADIGKFPNEDAQSLVFDASNLFQIDNTLAGTASKAAAAPTSVSVYRAVQSGPVRSTLCLGSLTSCSVRTRSWWRF